MNQLEKKYRKTRQVLTIKDKPVSVAKGFALGSFIGMLPIPGFQVLVSYAFASMLKINRQAACIAVFNTNIVTGGFVFAFNYWLGKKLLGIQNNFSLPEKMDWSFVKVVFMTGTDIFFPLTLGGVITGIIAAIMGYFITLRIMQRKSVRPGGDKNRKPFQTKFCGSKTVST